MSDIVARLRESADNFRCDMGLLAYELTEAADEIERLRAALGISQSWLDRWAAHVSDCRGGDQCSCGLTRVRLDASVALNQE